MPRTPLDFVQRGPFRVGVVTLEIADRANPGRSLATDVWYPARDLADGAVGSPAEHPLGRPHRADYDAPPRDGPFPLVVFSHGNSGLRRQSTFLTTHLASLGLVVAAPDHSGNTFFEMSRIEDEDERRRVHFEARRNRPRDLETVAATLAARDPRWPEVDASRIGILGHSYGGWAALKMPARDARVRAVCGLAPASEAFVGRRAFEPGELPLAPNIPALLVAGADDVLVDLEASVRPLYQRLRSPRALIAIDRCDHFHFCDGVELLHTLHERNPREKQTRATRPYADQLPEARVHRILCGLVGQFFVDTLKFGRDPCHALSPRTLSGFDPGLRRLEDTAEGEAA